MNNRKSGGIAMTIDRTVPVSESVTQQNLTEMEVDHKVEEVRLLDSLPASAAYYKAPKQRCAPCSIVRIVGSVMLGLVGGLILISYIPYWYHFGDSTITGTICLLIFHCLLGLMVTSYIQVIFTDPGTVPLEWHNAVSNSEQARKHYVKCHKSGLYKPPRAHFDSITGRLVLNMDHFCPWTNNTIGYFNRKFFVLFLFYTSLTCGWVAASFYPFLDSPAKDHSKKHAVDEDHYFNSSMIHIMTFMAFIFDVTFSIFLFCFFGLHLTFAMKNQTSIENGRRALKYRLDVSSNMESVFGKDRRSWLCPVYGDGPAGDGVHWLTRSGVWEGNERMTSPENGLEVQHNAGRLDGIQVV
mmetsp:Transcript_9427/g.11299  ORF Transcript_9427/g.11299 Transcript_9427/m.11299 type:complete len:354 (+) Transcript_9427:229-1290(+)